MEDKQKKMVSEDTVLDLDNLEKVSGGAMKDEIIINDTTDVSKDTKDNI